MGVYYRNINFNQKPYGTEKYTKDPCTQIVCTLALKYSLYRYIGPKVYAMWVHGPLGVSSILSPGLFALGLQVLSPACSGSEVEGLNSNL